MSTKDLYSIKMRSSQNVDGKEIHISGAEKIIHKDEIDKFASVLIDRGLNHSKGEADFLNLKVNRVNADDIIYLEALPVSTIEVQSYVEGRDLIRDFLVEIGVDRVKDVMSYLEKTYAMRGAMLLDVDTLERYERDLDRGIRATNMDRARNSESDLSSIKNHYEEAIVLATKVVNAPGIIGEICISDDPYYVTGYVASKEIGYRRITKLKEYGSENGGRIFLYRGNESDVDKTIEYLEKQYVIVNSVISKSDIEKNYSMSDTPLEASEAAMGKWDSIKNELALIKEKNLYRSMKTIESAQGSHIKYNGRDMVLMASNSYLDISAHPHMKAYVKDILDEYGFGSGGSRLTTGNTDIHDALERKIASFKNCERALVFSTGYVTNLATISALVGANDIIFSDELNHASIIDGCRLSKAKIVVYKHNDMADLERKIKENPAKRRLAVSDAVFSMDGDILKLPEFVEICDRYGVYSMIDEAHATGIIGETGHGIVEYYGNCKKADIMMGTLSKAIGAEGGYVAGNECLIEYLINKARGFIFSTSLSIPSMAAALAGIEIIEQETERVKALQDNVKYFCECLNNGGLNIYSDTAIVPVLVGDEGKALELSKVLLDKGYYISAIRYPTVPKNQARLRVALMATHTKEELKGAAEIICKYLK